MPSFRSSSFASVFSLLLAGVAFSQNNPQPTQYSFTISDSQIWTDTGLDLSAGETLTLTAETKPGSNPNCSPEGVQVIGGDFGKVPVAALRPGALIAKTAENAEPTLVGESAALKVTGAGHLFLGVNLEHSASCGFGVKLSVAQSATLSADRPALKQQLSSAAQVWLKGQLGSASAANTIPSSAVAGNENATTTSTSSGGLKLPAVILDADLRKHLDEIPRRVHDHLGNPGDMVNFVIVGSQDRAQATLDAANWHLADVDSKEAGLKAIMNTYQKKDYLDMPMSHLYLFDRMQDFGYEQAQAYAVVASRHHFRMWKAPFTWNGEIVFVGAGTHDVGFEKDVRSGHLTHKIDPDVDVERENIAQSLDKSGKVKSMTYYLPPEPVQDAKNASGGGYHSDGRLLVVFLQ